MRKLTVAETKLVSGGFYSEDYDEIFVYSEENIDEIIVTGQRISYDYEVDWGYTEDNYETYEDPFEDDYVQYADADGGSAPAPELTPEQIEAQVDALAEKAKEAILAKPDSNEREYGFIIYKDANGNIVMSEIIRGETVAEALADGRSSPSTPIGPVAQSILDNGGEILGLVHNHPDVGYTDDQDRANRNPSAGDWGALVNIGVGSNGGQATLDQLRNISQYIIDSDGVMREFELDDIADGHNSDGRNIDPDAGDGHDYREGNPNYNRR